MINPIVKRQIIYLQRSSFLPRPSQHSYTLSGTSCAFWHTRAQKDPAGRGGIFGGAAKQRNCHRKVETQSTLSEAPGAVTAIRLEKSLGSSIAKLSPKPPHRIPGRGCLSADLQMKASDKPPHPVLARGHRETEFQVNCVWANNHRFMASSGGPKGFLFLFQHLSRFET